MRRSLIESHIASAFQLSANGLTGKEFTVRAIEAPAAAEPFIEPILWQQTLSVVECPALWLAAGKDLWDPLARITLEAAGIEPITAEDTRSTWQEIIGQTVGAVATAITADVSREVTTTQGEELTEEPAGLNWTWFSVSDGETGPWLFRAAWAPELAALYNVKPSEAYERPATEAVSKTFDILLDVALPVSVSFGKTSLQIREVLKLNTGSIVELNRFVTDPVEVIVNDCVIARGEVVVVDGNYGVRIKQLATREDRLRTGMGEGPRNGVKS